MVARRRSLPAGAPRATRRVRDPASIRRAACCIGTLEGSDPLVVTVAERARAAAFDDPRFTGLRRWELVDLDVEVSVLSPMAPIAAGSYHQLVATLRAGVDGVVVAAGRRRATLLPSVWESLPEPAAFVEALWRKAGLDPGEWPAGIDVFRYAAQHAARTASVR